MAASNPVGMIGLGLMGTALSARLADAGMPVVGFDIDPPRRRPSAGTAVNSAAKVMARCRTIVMAVFDAGQVEAAFAGCREPGLADVVICTTTCAPDDIARLANRASRLHLRFVEAPISGTSAEA